jgi:tripartite-type tricarboxylate transporter receptor subunit TctC
MQTKHRARRLLLAMAIGAAVHAPAQAQSAADHYPNRPIKMVVSFAAGGTTDILARLLAQKLSTALGQPVIVENRPGAGGIVGNDYVAKSPPDGYTLLLGSTSSFAVNVSLYSSMPYDQKKELAPLMEVASGPFIIVINPAVPAQNLQEFIALAKTEPGRLNFGSSGNGTSTHLAGELLNSMAGIKITHVPYKGTGPAMQDTLSGNVQMTITDMAPLVPYIESGKLRPLAQTGAQRSKLLPNLPTVAETVPGYDATSWYGIMVPARTPKPIVDKLNAELTKILSAPDVQQRFAQLGVEAVPDTPEHFGAYIASETAKWAEIVKRSGAKVD